MLPPLPNPFTPNAAPLHRQVGPNHSTKMPLATWTPCPHGRALKRQRTEDNSFAPATSEESLVPLLTRTYADLYHPVYKRRGPTLPTVSLADGDGWPVKRLLRRRWAQKKERQIKITWGENGESAWVSLADVNYGDSSSSEDDHHEIEPVDRKARRWRYRTTVTEEFLVQWEDGSTPTWQAAEDVGTSLQKAFYEQARAQFAATMGCSSYRSAIRLLDIKKLPHDTQTDFHEAARTQ